jgi:hypothetical protein
MKPVGDYTRCLFELYETHTHTHYFCSQRIDLTTQEYLYTHVSSLNRLSVQLSNSRNKTLNRFMLASIAYVQVGQHLQNQV